jgi:hypothetical protein
VISGSCALSDAACWFRDTLKTAATAAAQRETQVGLHFQTLRTTLLWRDQIKQDSHVASQSLVDGMKASRYRLSMHVLIVTGMQSALRAVAEAVSET